MTISATVKDTLIILATLLSPLIAVQVSKYIERIRARRDEQISVFKTLMATRSRNLDFRHVEALNIIDIVFHGSSTQEKEVRLAWKKYLDHLNTPGTPDDFWETKRQELFVNLLYSMAKLLKFDLDETHIKNQTYLPSGHGDVEADTAAIRKAFRSLLTGESALPMTITNFPEQQQSKQQLDNNSKPADGSSL